MEPYVTNYTIAPVDIPTDLRLMFMKEHPWIEDFVVLKNIVNAPEPDYSSYKYMFSGVIVGLGPITQNGVDANGDPKLNVQYEIVGAPPDLEDVFIEIVKGEGNIFNAVKNVINGCLLGFISAIMEEVKGEVDKQKTPTIIDKSSDGALSPSTN